MSSWAPTKADFGQKSPVDGGVMPMWDAGRGAGDSRVHASFAVGYLEGRRRVLSVG